MVETMLGPEEFIKDAIQKIKEQIGDEKAIIALSGGVDSSVCSVLVQEAIGDNLIAIFVDHGLLREGEVEEASRGKGGGDTRRGNHPASAGRHAL